jgi:hypothetical protein
VPLAAGAAPAGEPLERLRSCWPVDVEPVEAAAVEALVREGMTWLERWHVGGFAALPSGSG